MNPKQTNTFYKQTKTNNHHSVEEFNQPIYNVITIKHKIHNLTNKNNNNIKALTAT